MPATSLEGLESRTEDRWSRWVRRLVLLLILLLVLAGASGALGVRTTSASTDDAGWTLRLRCAAVARAGLDVPWQISVTHAGGFDKSIVLAVTGDYLDIYETQGFHPEPSAEARDAHTLYLTFDKPPGGDTFVVAYDAYIQPSSQRGRSGTVSVLSGGVRRASVDFRTRLLP